MCNTCRNCRYMLTQEGKDAARECLMRSGLEKPAEKSVSSKGCSVLNVDNISHQEPAHPGSDTEVTLFSTSLSKKDKSFEIPEQYVDKVNI